MFYRDANWLARINLLHAFAQRDIADNETETAGYDLLRVELSYNTKLAPSPFDPRELTVGVIGNNLLNEQIRSAVSYTKNEVLMPGLNVRLLPTQVLIHTLPLPLAGKRSKEKVSDGRADAQTTKSQSARIGPATPSNAPSASSHTRSRRGSTGPGMMARPFESA